MPAPLVSIVTPCLNPGAHLREAIQSVLDQDYQHIEYLVMDGGSTDGTVEYLRSLGNRVRWISQRDAGQAAAINQGFARMQGEVLAWLNADDLYAPGAVSAAVRTLQDHPRAPLVYGDAYFVDAVGAPIAPCAHIEPWSRRRLIHYSDFIVQPAAFFRRADFEAVGGLDERLNWTLDYDLWLKLAARGPAIYLPQVLALYRWLGESKTASGGWARLDEIRRVLRAHGHATPAYVRLECVNALLQDARKALADGKPVAAARQVLGALATVVASPRAIESLFQPRTWRIIYTGQVLRKRAIKPA